MLEKILEYQLRTYKQNLARYIYINKMIQRDILKSNEQILNLWGEELSSSVIGKRRSIDQKARDPYDGQNASKYE